MSFNLNELETNKEAEKDGVWVDYLDGSRLKIARMGNQSYKAFLAMKYKQNRIVIDRGDKNSDALAETINIEAVARFILLDWEGINLGKKSTEYSPEIGIKSLTHLPDFKADVDNFANDTALYRDVTTEDDKEALKK